jgi:hypothetical protein
MWLLYDDDNIVRCMATEECNLHQSKIDAGMTKLEAPGYSGVVGDEIDPVTKAVTPRPENYRKPSAAEQEAAKKAKYREIAILKQAAVEATADGDAATAAALTADAATKLST